LTLALDDPLDVLDDGREAVGERRIPEGGGLRGGHDGCALLPTDGSRQVTRRRAGRVLARRSRRRYRPPLVRSGQEAATALAVDIGGTKLAVGRVSDDGRVLARAQIPTPVGRGPDDAETMWRALAELVAAVREGDELVCGVGCGGPMSPAGVEVSPLNIPAWRRFPLRDRLAAETGLPVHVDND